jgi:hypothetical protein
MLMGHLPRVRFAGAVRDAGVIRACAGRFRRYQGNNDHGACRCVKALNGACGIFLTWAPRAHAVQAEDVRDAPAPAHGGTLDGGGRGPARRVLPADAARHARAHGAVVPRAWLRADYERLGRHCDLRIQIDWVEPPSRVFLQWDACNCVSGTCAQVYFVFVFGFVFSRLQRCITRESEIVHTLLRCVLTEGPVRMHASARTQTIHKFLWEMYTLVPQWRQVHISRR